MTRTQQLRDVLRALPGTQLETARALGVPPQRLRLWGVLARLEDAGVDPESPVYRRAAHRAAPPSEALLAAAVALLALAAKRAASLVASLQVSVPQA